MNTKQKRCLNLREASDLAFSVAENSDVKNSQHGAVAIGKRGNIIATGYNITNMKQKKLPFLTYHAEETLIHNIKSNEIHNIKYIVIVRKGENKTSKPCSRCTKLLNKRLPNTTIFYSN